jgi:hypothetical protein
LLQPEDNLSRFLAVAPTKDRLLPPALSAITGGTNAEKVLFGTGGEIIRKEVFQSVK